MSSYLFDPGISWNAADPGSNTVLEQQAARAQREKDKLMQQMQ